MHSTIDKLFGRQSSSVFRRSARTFIRSRDSEVINIVLISSNGIQRRVGHCHRWVAKLKVLLRLLHVRV
jgi:hypothetical protein